MNTKAELRKTAGLHRKSLVRPDFAARLARFAKDLNLTAGAIVSGYCAFRDEADPRPLMMVLAGMGHPLCLPCIVGKGEPLCFRRWHETDVLRVHSYGVSEPLEDAEVLTPSVLLVPLLAFDAAGYRLGYGGGFYDRTLAVLREAGPVTAIGVAYVGQEVAAVPHHDHDQRLDAVLTENGLVRFA